MSTVDLGILLSMCSKSFLSTLSIPRGVCNISYGWTTETQRHSKGPRWLGDTDSDHPSRPWHDSVSFKRWEVFKTHKTS